MTRSLRLLSVLFALCAVPACGSPPDEAPATESEKGGTARYVSDDGNVDVTVTFPTGGITRGENHVLLSPRPVRATCPVGVRSVSAFMPAHGHGAPPVTTSAHDGVVDATLMLTMPGRWEISAELGCEDGVADTVRFAVSVP